MKISNKVMLSKEGDYMQAIILAAGMGKRLKELTQNNTKVLLKV